MAERLFNEENKMRHQIGGKPNEPFDGKKERAELEAAVAKKATLGDESKSQKPQQDAQKPTLGNGGHVKGDSVRERMERVKQEQQNKMKQSGL